MKKKRRLYPEILFSFVLLAAMLFCISAAQADSVEYDYGRKTVTVTCNHLEPGVSYSFIATKGKNVKSLSESKILYLNQLKADSNGCIQVLFVYEDFRSPDTIRFYMGGKLKDQTSPHLVGKYQGITSNITIPEKLKTIEDESFAGGIFQAVYLGDKVTKIGSKAFQDCKALVYIQIPATVREIAEDAFEGCGKLTVGCVKGSPAYQYALAHGYYTDELTAPAE